ncbi:MAG: PAS domain-containing protein [Proteobacteria bacterium]|nr:PAS domain-containing protein [Pseudomonadota bacterium]MBI3498944.1 PAS domain-containing protein [Pseudomonadota bacterium]
MPHALAAFAALTILIGASLLAFNLWLDHRRILSAAEERTATLAGLLAAHAGETVQRVDLVLISVLDLLSRSETSPPPSQGALVEALRQLKPTDKLVRTIIVLDAEGRAEYNSGANPPDVFSFSDRPYFAVHRDNPDFGLDVEAVITSQVSGHKILPISRRRATADGSFAGVVVAFIEWSMLEQFYGSINVGKQGIINLFRRDVVLIGRVPFDDGIVGKGFADLPQYRALLPAAPQGNFRLVSPIDGVARIAAYRAVPGTPLVVMVGLSEDEVLASWRVDVVYQPILGALISFGLAALTVLLYRRLSEGARSVAGLRESEIRFRTLVENIPGIIFYRGQPGGGARLYGRDAQEIAGILAPEGKANLRLWRGSIAPEDREAYGAAIQRRRGQGQPYRLEFRITHPGTGRQRWVREVGYSVSEAGDDRVFYDGYIVDVTPEREILAQLIKAKEGADMANRAKSQFLANMSHELRTPLNAILGFSEALVLGHFGQLSDRQRGYVRDIHGAGQHLLSLIGDLLDIAKLEAGGLALHEEQIDLSRLIEEGMRLVGEQAEQGGIRLTSTISEDLPQLRGDTMRLKQVLINLLSNAIKYTEEGGTVHVGLEQRDDGGVSLTVVDTGIGMTDSEIAIALEPFRQVENEFNRRHSGTGLGLPLVKSLVELHGGRLEIDSAPGKGTRVAAIFPADRVITRTAILAEPT